MKRWLFNIAAAGSLLAGVLIVIMWVRSEFIEDRIVFEGPGIPNERITTLFETPPGGIFYYRRHVLVTPQSRMYSQLDEAWTAERSGWASTPRQPGGRRYWFELLETEITQNGIVERRNTVGIPYWAPLLFSSILPTIWMVKFRRQQRRKLIGCCTKCGYDLRATPDRCPECGTVPALSS